MLCCMMKHTMDPMREQLSARLLEINHPGALSDAYIAADQLAASIVPCMAGRLGVSAFNDIAHTYMCVYVHMSLIPFELYIL